MFLYTIEVLGFTFGGLKVRTHGPTETARKIRNPTDAHTLSNGAKTFFVQKCQ